MATTRTRSKEKVTATLPVEGKEIPVVEKAAEPVAASVEVKTAPKKIKHDPDELYTCISLCQGELIYQSKKTDNLYIWSNYGDELQIPYQDLLPLMVTRSPFLFKPLFMIDDMGLVNEWTMLKDVYTNIYDYDNLEQILAMDEPHFRSALLNMPEGIRDSFKSLIATRVDENAFDSLSKIKAADQILGTDLYCLIS